MLRIQIPEPHHILVEEAPRPEPAAGEVLLRVRAVGICGSDLHTLEGRHPFVTYPVWPGHEVCGDIVDVGPGVDDSLVGRKAVLEPSIPKGARPRFEPGRYNIAGGLAVMGFQAPGAMSEYAAIPLDRLHLLPDTFTYQMGAAVEPAAVAVHGVLRAGTIAGRDVAVIGGGTIGLLTAQTARAYGAATVHLVDTDPKRRKLAEDIGLDVRAYADENAYETVFECVGAAPALRSALLCCRKGGTLVILGVFGEDVMLPVGLVQDWELDLRGALMYTGDDYREAIRLIGAGALLVDALVTDRFPLAEARAAFARALERGGVLKVVLENPA